MFENRRDPDVRSLKPDYRLEVKSDFSQSEVVCSFPIIYVNPAGFEPGDSSGIYHIQKVL